MLKIQDQPLEVQSTYFYIDRRVKYIQEEKEKM